VLYLDDLSESQFYAIGLSYKKTDAETRGLFSLNKESQVALLKESIQGANSSIFLISTCNRTELYGFVADIEILYNLLAKHSDNKVESLKKIAYSYKGEKAINHLFKVGCGMDSQIIGDFEVIGQVKKSYILSLKYGTSDAFLDRLINSVIHASKRVKSETKISSGATSVSFAGIQFIRNKFEDFTNKNILLYGIGKLGRNTCDNIIKHTSRDSITLINRSIDKAVDLGKKYGIVVKDAKYLNEEIAQCDILFVATGAQSPTITKANVTQDKPLLILDLSIPRNVDPDVASLRNVTLLNLDELSQLTNQTLNDRKKHLPHALEIIEETKNEFLDWIESRRMVPTITALNHKLKQYKDIELQKLNKEIGVEDHQKLMNVSDKLVQKITGQIASYLRNNSRELDKDLKFINHIFQLEENHQNG